MKNLRRVALAFVAAQVSATAQTPEPEIAPFKEAAELTEALIKPGRCPKNHTESYLVACAVVKYVAIDDPLDIIYRPIFRIVSAGGGDLAVWTISLGTGFRAGVKKVSIDDVLKDIRTNAPGKDGAKKRYMPVDVFGYQDNRAACAADKFSKACHSSPRLQTDPFERYRFELPTSDADQIWR